MAFTKEQLEEGMKAWFIQFYDNEVFGVTVGRLDIHITDYTEYSWLLGVNTFSGNEIVTTDEFRDFDKAISFAIRLRDIYTRAQTEYEELVKEFSNK